MKNIMEQPSHVSNNTNEIPVEEVHTALAADPFETNELKDNGDAYMKESLEPDPESIYLSKKDDPDYEQRRSALEESNRNSRTEDRHKLPVTDSYEEMMKIVRAAEAAENLQKQKKSRNFKNDPRTDLREAVNL